MTGKSLKTGTIGWVDLTVDTAEAIRDFYSSVIGWKPEPLSMGDYDDFVMNAPLNKEAVAGICHARGGNADMPQQWLIYITVPDINESIKKCESLSGKIIVGLKEMGDQGKYCVI